MAGAKTTVAMAMTTKPPPCDAPVSRCDGPLKLWMSCWNGAYMTATMICPPMPIGMPTRSIDRKRRPRSRTKWRVPWVRLASQGAPMKPIHRPSRVDTTYHSGGHGGRGDGLHLRRASCRRSAPATQAKISGADLPDEEADDGVDEPAASPGAWSAGGPTAYRGRGRRCRRGRRRWRGGVGGRPRRQRGSGAGGGAGGACCCSHSRGT